jgi:hypothetical protein
MPPGLNMTKLNTCETSFPQTEMVECNTKLHKIITTFAAVSISYANEMRHYKLE